MNVHQVIELSGLSRAQIDLLISRHGYTPQGNVVGRGRQYAPVDAFTLKLIAVLLEHGFSNDHAVQATSFPVLQDSLGPAELYPLREQREAEGQRSFFVISADAREHDFVNEARLMRMFRDGRVSWLVVDVAAIAKQIDHADA
ncbi:MerR family transcriptional regulator [Tianweitania populi]|uniref:HTH merR-type domain-containing protein n=1 Tax=Tianweitania populi TaxID=1607949 RepID=A0A8J3GJ51_9HYPH|nr:MerR family transcriptional regulator [Tianweitania populi]GHD07686.1 hypothetical protein GCM10016234_06380 [Tianweitania populi]